MKLFFFLGCAAAFLITTMTAATPALRGIINEDDDDYPHLLDCLTHGSSSESACTSRDDCVWCTASCGCRGVCVSTHATSFFDDASDYTCPNNNDDDAVPTDDDSVPTDDDTVPTDDDNITPDTNYMDHLLECLAEGYPTNCANHEGNTTCVWCHASALDSSMCFSSEAADGLSGYIYTCDFNTTIQNEDDSDKDEKHYVNEIRRPNKEEDTAKVDEVSVTNTKSSTKHYFNAIRRPVSSTTTDHETSVTDTNKRYFNEIRRPDSGQNKSDTTKHYFNEIRRPTKKEGEVDGARATDTKKYLNEVRRPTKDSTTPVALEEEM